MDLIPVHWASWWYGFAAGCVFTVVSVVIMWVYTLCCTVKNIRRRYSQYPAVPDEENIRPLFSGINLYESEQIPFYVR